MTWKKSMQVVQTEGEPPNWGKTIRAIIGWTRNRVAAATRMVTAERVRRGVLSSSFNSCAGRHGSWPGHGRRPSAFSAWSWSVDGPALLGLLQLGGRGGGVDRVGGDGAVGQDGDHVVADLGEPAVDEVAMDRRRRSWCGARRSRAGRSAATGRAGRRARRRRAAGRRSRRSRRTASARA